MKRYTFPIAALAALALGVGSANAQTVSHTQTIDMANQGGNNLADKAFRISVKPGNAKYVKSVQAGSGTGPLGDGTLLDWQVHTAVNGESPFAGSTLDTPPGTYFDTATCADSSVGGPQNYFDLWVANDVDTEVADFPNGTTPAVGNQPTPIGGNIDISGLEDGQIYVLNGTYRARVRVNLTMTGPGKTPIVMPEYQSDHDASTNRMRLMEFAFTNPGGEYTNIEWSSNNGQNNTGRRRWGGIFLDGTIFVDTVDPTWEAGWPNANPVGSTLFTLNTNVNEACSAYYVVLPDGATAPTSAQVKAGTDAADAPVALSGNFASGALVESPELVTGLTASTAYDVYVVAEDVRGPNLQATPVLLEFTTNATDLTAPNWTATYPQQSRTPTAVTGTANIDEAGNAWFVVLATGASAPSSAQVKAGTDASDVAAPGGTMLALTAGVDGSDVVGGLTVGAAYDVWFVAEDLEGNLQATPTMVSSAAAAAVDQFTSAGSTWGTDSVWSTLTGGPYTDAWGDGNNAVFEGGSGTVVVDSGTTVGDITFNSNNWLLTGGPLVLAGATTPTINTNGNLGDFENVISGTQGLIKEGTGTMRFNSNNTTNTITGGWALNGGNLGDNSGNLGVNELNGNDITTNGASNVGITFRSGTFSSAFTLNAPFTRMSNNNSTVTINGAVTGPGGIEMNKTGDGTNNLRLFSTSNSFTGGVNMTSSRQCELRVRSFVDSASLGSGNIRFVTARADRYHRFYLDSGFNAPLTFNNRQFDIADNGEDDSNEAVEIRSDSAQAFTINTDLIVSGTSNKRLSLRGTGAGINTFAGAIPDGAADVLSLLKQDSGTWVLSGANSHTGGTSALGGTLTIDGSLADSSMTISSGTVNGAGTLTFNPTDLIDMSGGTLDLSGLTVEGAGLTDPVYVIIDSVDGGSYTGTFATENVPGYTVNYDYDGNGTQVALEAAASPYDSWAGTTHGLDPNWAGTPDDPMDGSPDGDPDGDGNDNLYEFGVGLDPTTSDNAALTVTSGTEFTPGNPIVVVSHNPLSIKMLYVRHKDPVAAGVTYTPKFSDNGGSFVTDPADPTPSSESTEPGDYEVVSVPFLLFGSDGKKASAMLGQLEVAEIP